MASDLWVTAWQNVVQTASYLFAYNYVLILAPGAHLALLALAPGRRGWLGDRRGPFTAWSFGALDLSIRYKLIPEQLWQIS